MTNIDNRVQLQDCENNNDVSSDTSAAPTTSVNDSGAVIQGTNAIAFQVDDAQEMLLFDQDSASATFSLDLTDSTVYLNVKHNLCESFANLGGQIVFKDAADTIAGDAVGYNVNGNDVAGFPYLFRYTTIKLDVSVIVATPGVNNVDYYEYEGTEAGLNHAAILQVGYGSFNVEKAISTGKNAWCDGIYYIANDSYALSITGGTVGTPETTADVAADDVAAGGGMVNNPKGSEYGFFAPTEWGDSGSSDSYYTGTDEQWFWIGDNAGGHAVAATHFPMRVVGNGSSVNSFVLTRVTIVGVSTRAEFDMSNADVDFMQLVSCTLVDIGTITFPTVDVDKFVNNTVFINCAQIYPSTMAMDGNTFIGSTEANGALLWDTGTNEEVQDNLSFISDGTGHAIHINPTGDGGGGGGEFTFNITGYSASGYVLTDLGSTGNTFFLVDNNNDNDMTINIIGGIGGSDAQLNYERAAGYTGTVTIVSSVTLSLTGIETDSEVRIINLDDVENFNKELNGAELIEGGTQSAVIANGGSGYTNGTQTLTIVGGTGTATQISVEVVSNVVDSINNITVAGSYTVNPPTPATTTGGGGTGATFRLNISGQHNFVYSSSGFGGTQVAIIVFHLDFKEVRIEQSLATQSQSIPIQQTTDRVFNT